MHIDRVKADLNSIRLKYKLKLRSWLVTEIKTHQQWGAYLGRISLFSEQYNQKTSRSTEIYSSFFSYFTLYFFDSIVLAVCPFFSEKCENKSIREDDVKYFGVPCQIKQNLKNVKKKKQIQHVHLTC